MTGNPGMRPYCAAERVRVYSIGDAHVRANGPTGYATTDASFLDEPASGGPVPEREVDMVVTHSEGLALLDKSSM
jgi:hypothetical protein